MSINSPAVEPNIYYIGKTAITGGLDIYNMGLGLDNDKSNSEVPIVNTLGQIAAYSVKKAYYENNLNNQISVIVDMVTALPVTQHTKATAAIFADRFMKGRHNVIVYLGSQAITVDILFRYVKILPEGIPTVHYLQAELQTSSIFNEFSHKYNVKIDGTYFKNKKILHVSIGDGTTELPLTDDILFDPFFIKGLDNGTGHAIEKALEPFKKDAHLRMFSRQDFSKVLRDDEHKYHKFAADRIHEPLEAEAVEIYHAIMQQIQKSKNEVDIIMVYGGGSVLMRKHLEPKLEDMCTKANIKLFYVPTEYAVPVEAFGMYAFAKGNIFNALLEKHINSVESEAATSDEA